MAKKAKTIYYFNGFFEQLNPVLPRELGRAIKKRMKKALKENVENEKGNVT